MVDQDQEAIPFEGHVSTPRTAQRQKCPFTPRPIDPESSRDNRTCPETPLYNSRGSEAIPGAHPRETISTSSIDALSNDLKQKVAELACLVADLPMRLRNGQQPTQVCLGYREASQYSDVFETDLAVRGGSLSSGGFQVSRICSHRDSATSALYPSDIESATVKTSLVGSTITEKTLESVPSVPTPQAVQIKSWSQVGTDSALCEDFLYPRARHNSVLPFHLTKNFSQVFASKASAAGKRLRLGVLFEPFFAVLIFSNAIFKAFSLQYRSEVGAHLSWAHIVDSAFTIVFGFEIVIRMYGWRLQPRVGRWDIFDVIVVSCMGCDKVLRMTINVPWVNPSYLLSVLRIFRVTAAWKKYDILYRLSLTRQARLLGLSIKAGLTTTLSVLGCLAALVYLIAIVMANGALDLCNAENDQQELCFYFGTLWRSFASAYQFALGGISWVVLVDALIGAEMHYHASVFILFVSVFTIGLLHIILGMLVWLVRDVFESEQKLHFMQNHLEEKRLFVEQMATLFNDIDLNSNGLISKDELTLALEDERITSLFVMMDLDSTAVENLFDLLDLDSSGFVDVREFSLGCSRLRGKARAVDLERTRRDVAAIRSAVEQLMPILNTDSSPTSGSKALIPTKPQKVYDASVQIKSIASATSVFAAPTSVIGRHSIATAKSLVGGKYQQLIEKPELRALTLSQLQDVPRIVAELCGSERWEDPQHGAPLDEAKVNLYDFAFHYINPRTSSDCITLVGLAPGDYKTGQILTQVSADTGRICAKAEVIVDTSGPELHVKLLKGMFIASEDEETRHSYRVLLDSEDSVGTLSAVHQVRSLSYKELISSEPTTPEWFVCHWWGEPILDFVACCEEHSSRRLADTYWVCAYANRQHDLGADIGDSPESSCFMKSMAHANGLLLMLDPAAMAFQRIWCCFELYQTVTSEKMLDIVTMSKNRKKPQLLTQMPLAGERPEFKCLREKQFPLSVLTKGVQVSLENGNASKEEDKVHILESMGKDPRTGSFSLELQQRNFDFANRALRGYIAVAAWPQAITKGRVLNFDLKSSESVSLPEILKQDCNRVALDLCFSGMQEVTDADVASISQGLPPKLTCLKLRFQGCYGITDRGLSSLADSIEMSQLTELELDFTGCKLLTDAGISYLVMRLPSALSRVTLQFALIPNLSKKGAKSCADHLPTSLSYLRITFRGTGFDHQFDSLRQLRKMTR